MHSTQTLRITSHVPRTEQKDNVTGDLNYMKSVSKGRVREIYIKSENGTTVAHCRSVMHKHRRGQGFLENMYPSLALHGPHSWELHPYKINK